MPTYKSNSHKSKENTGGEREKLEKVISGAVKTKKKSGLNKLTDIFISQDASNVKEYIVSDVIIPEVTGFLRHLIDYVADGLLGSGSGRNRRSSSGGTRYDVVSYNKIAGGGSRYASDRPKADTRFSYDELLFETRGDADTVLSQMEDMIDRYGVVSVADMYDAAQLTAPYTANRYGWTSVRNAQVTRVSDGYIIKMSRPSPIE